MKQKSLIAEANDRVSIVSACLLVGIDIEDGRTEGSTKTYCPFGRLHHSDGGKEPALRIYPQSNSAYCFSCKKYFSPAGLVAEAFDITKKQAAAELLTRVGYKPISAMELWQNVQEEEIRPDTSMLGMALKTFCSRIYPDWDKLQFQSNVATSLDSCLALLDAVVTDADAELWLTLSKKVMSKFKDKDGQL